MFVTQIAAILMIVLACGISTAGGAMAAAAKGGGGNTNTQSLMKGRAPASPVKKTTEFVKSIDGRFLSTESGRYSLSGVKVTDRSAAGNKTERASLIKKTAEMTFVNNQLREVVIRQRK